MKYKNYVFDLYGTLIDVSTNEEKYSLWKTMADLYACFGAVYEPKELKKQFKKMDLEAREEMSRTKGTPYPEIQLERVFLRLLKEAPQRGGKVLYRENDDDMTYAGVRKIENEAIWAEMAANVFRVVSRKYLRLFPETLQVLNTLKENGCKIYLLSNAQAVFTRPEIQLMGIEPYFDVMYLSSDYDMKKPEPMFLQSLIEQEGLRCSETVMIGNEMESDVKIADACGVDGIFVNLLHEDLEMIRKRSEQCGIKQNYRVIETIGEVVKY